MAGKPVERPFSDILTSIRYWVILSIIIEESSTGTGLPEDASDDCSTDNLDFTYTYDYTYIRT